MTKPTKSLQAAQERVSNVHKRLLRRPNFSGRNYEAEANDLGLFVSGQIVPFVS